MEVFLVNLVLSALISYYSTGNVELQDRKNNRMPVSFYLILMIWACLFAFRDLSVGSDTRNYYSYFLNVKNQHSGDITVFLTENRDVLYGIHEYIWAKLLNSSWIVFQFATAILIYLPILSTIYHHSENPTLSIILYIGLMYYLGGFNGTRQAIAMGFLFFGYYSFLVKKRYLSYLICAFLAFGFHSSVLLVMIFYFVSTRGIQSKSAKISVAILILSYIFLWNLWAYVIQILDTIGQTKMANDYANIGEDGSGVLRLLTELLPTLLALIYINNLREKYEYIDNELYLALCSTLFLMLSTRNWIFARVGSYMGMFRIMLIPKLQYSVSESSKGLFSFIIVVLCVAYMVLMLLHHEGAFYPYTFLKGII